MSSVARRVRLLPDRASLPGIAHLKVTSAAIAWSPASTPTTSLAWSSTSRCSTSRPPARDASVDRVVEIGIVVGRRGEIVARDNWLINPGMPIPAEVTAIHHITDEMVADKPRFETVAAEIANALKGCIPAAYNAFFDRAFILAELESAGYLRDHASAGACHAASNGSIR